MKTLLFKVVFTIGTTAIAYTPIWIILLAKTVFLHTGLWQKIILYGAEIYLLGVIQIILFIVWIMALVIIWKEKD